MSKEKIYQVPGPLKQKALLNNEEYERMYKESLNDPEKFWSKQASSYLEWFSSWHTVSKSNFHKGEFSWFEGGKINASTNCIDRHLKKKSKETAIIWEGDDPSLSKEISYQELHEYVCKLANALKKRGVKIIGPANGKLACGEIGMGRMEDIKIIKTEIENYLNSKNKLSGKKILITAGPTIEEIDPIRYISNFSSGKQGFAIAEKAHDYGAETILITGPTNIEPPEVNKVIKIESAEQMYNESIRICYDHKTLDIAFLTAAVSDWKINKFKKKYKKNENIFKKIKFIENKDILKTISNLKKNRPKIVCGFAAETNSLIKNAREKLLNKNCDLIFANKITPQFNPMGNDINQISIVGKNKQEKLVKMSKKRIAEKIIKVASSYLN